MKVVITGASGGLGGHLVEAFTEAGHQVTGLCRNLDRVRHLRNSGARFAVADVREMASLTPGLLASDCLVHTVATVGGGHSWAEHQATDVQGTANVIEAARRAGCGRLIHISSVTVYDGLHTGGRLDENCPLRSRTPRWDTYTRSKLEVEALVRRQAGAANLPLTVLRPSVMLGRHDRHTTPRVLAFLGSALAGCIGPGDNRIPCVDLDELARLVLAATEADASLGQTYNVSGSQGVALRDLLNWHAMGMGQQWRRHYPARVARGAATVLELANKPVNEKRTALLDRFMVEVATLDCHIDCSRAARDLGWRGEADLRASINEAIQRNREINT